MHLFGKHWDKGDPSSLKQLALCVCRLDHFDLLIWFNPEYLLVVNNAPGRHEILRDISVKARQQLEQAKQQEKVRILADINNVSFKHLQ